MRRFFNVNGRARRTEMWFANIAVSLLSVMAYIFFEMFDQPSAGDWLSMVLGLAVVPVTIRRLHDRNRSGRWLLVFWVLPIILILPWDWALPRMDAGTLPAAVGLMLFIPGLAGVLLALWGAVEVLILPAAAGAQRFGADPRV